MAFFSDAVFAIELTLLAAELRLPPDVDVLDVVSLIDALTTIGPSRPGAARGDAAGG